MQRGRKASPGPAAERRPPGRQQGLRDSIPPEAPRPAENYDADDSPPPEEILQGDVFDGVVTFANVRSGVFVDFGGPRDGYLRTKSKARSFYRVGMELFGLTVVSHDPETGKTVLQTDPDEQQVAEPRPQSPPSRGRSSSPPKRRSRRGRRSRSASRTVDWKHVDGMPLEEFEEGQSVEGVVTNTNRYGVFIDFGSVRDGRVMDVKGYEREFKVGDQLRVTIDMVDLRERKVGLILSDFDGTMEILHQARVPLEDIEDGVIVNGIISHIERYGAFVNVGARVDGLLKAPWKVLRELVPGQHLEGLRVGAVDPERGRIPLTFADMEEQERSPSPEARGSAAKPSPRAAAPQPRAAAASPRAAPPPRASSAKPKRAVRAPLPPEEAEEPEMGEEDLIPIEVIRRGELADGIVVSITPRGVMVDIGADTLGILRVSPTLRKHFQVYDVVEGMVVEEVNVQNRQVILSMDDPKLAVVDRLAASPRREREMPSPRAPALSSGPRTATMRRAPSAKAPAARFNAKAKSS